MNRILLLFSFLSLTINSYSQNSDELRVKAQNRAKKEVAYIAEQMKLTPNDIVYLENSFTTKFLYVSTYTKVVDVTTEYKKAIYKKSSEWIATELNKYFSSAETEQILLLFKTRRDHNKKVKSN